MTDEPTIVQAKPDELLPCPFCGSEAGFEHDNREWRVFCRDNKEGDCPIGYANTIGYPRRVEAARGWNKRCR